MTKKVTKKAVNKPIKREAKPYAFLLVDLAVLLPGVPPRDLPPFMSICKIKVEWGEGIGWSQWIEEALPSWQPKRPADALLINRRLLSNLQTIIDEFEEEFGFGSRYELVVLDPSGTTKTIRLKTTVEIKTTLFLDETALRQEISLI